MFFLKLVLFVLIMDLGQNDHDWIYTNIFDWNSSVMNTVENNELKSAANINWNEYI